MIDQQSVERAAEQFRLPEGSFERLALRRDRKRRNQRIRAGVLGLAIAIAVGWLGVNAIRSTPSVPADPPEEPSVDLGIFEPVAGRMVYTNSGLWAVDLNARSPVSTLVRLGPEGGFPLGWSSDGTELLLRREHQYLSTLYILHADGTETQLNRRAMYFDGATIAPDGTRVVFAIGDTRRTLAPPDGWSPGLYVVDVEGGRPVRIAEEGKSPAFSPDGTQIAYLVSGPAEDEEHVWVADADGSDAQEMADVSAGVTGGLTWSPAGDRIAAHNTYEGAVAIYTFAPDGSDFTKVITDGMNPFWSPDGSQIAYMRPYGDPLIGSPGLAIVDADGSNVRTFGFGASGPWHPGSSTPVEDPDGSTEG